MFWINHTVLQRSTSVQVGQRINDIERAEQAVISWKLKCFWFSLKIGQNPIGQQSQAVGYISQEGLEAQTLTLDCCCCSVSKSDSLWPHGLQHARLLCPPLTPGVCSNSCPLSRQCFVTIFSYAAHISFCLQSFPASGFFSIELALHIRWPKYQELQLQPQSF